MKASGLNRKNRWVNRKVDLNTREIRHVVVVFHLTRSGREVNSAVSGIADLLAPGVFSGYFCYCDYACVDLLARFVWRALGEIALMILRWAYDPHWNIVLLIRQGYLCPFCTDRQTDAGAGNGFQAPRFHFKTSHLSGTDVDCELCLVITYEF